MKYIGSEFTCSWTGEVWINNKYLGAVEGESDFKEAGLLEILVYDYRTSSPKRLEYLVLESKNKDTKWEFYIFENELEKLIYSNKQ